MRNTAGCAAARAKAQRQLKLIRGDLLAHSTDQCETPTEALGAWVGPTPDKPFDVPRCPGGPLRNCGHPTQAPPTNTH
eukprot:1890797-Alexandrium_andersonii.AAC.1